MDPINPWLDPVEVRRLADLLMQPSREPSVTVADAGFDEGFVGYAAAQVVRQETPPPPPVREVPATPVSIPAAPENPIIARGPFLDRVTRFRDWMRHHFAATGIFILDHEGVVIFDEGNHGRLHFLARSLALGSRRPAGSAGNVRVKIGAGTTLEVIPAETAYGSLVLGAVVAESLAPASVVAVMEVLAQVAPLPGEDLKSQI